MKSWKFWWNKWFGLIDGALRFIEKVDIDMSKLKVDYNGNIQLK